MIEEPITNAERRRARRPESPDDAAPMRALPVSLEAEQGTLCSLYLDPVNVMELLQEHRVKSEWFHIPAHQMLYATFAGMCLAGVPLDYCTVTQALHDAGTWETIGGGGMVTTILGYIPTAANVDYYLQTLEEKHTLREVIRVGTESVQEAYTQPDDAAGIVGRLQTRATQLSLRGSVAEDTFRDILMKTSERWAERRDGKSQQICTGYPRLDEASPIRRKHTVVISGRRKSGKSALAGSIVLRVAGMQKLPTLVFSLEMPSDEWVDRLISEQGEISQKRIHSGRLEEKDWDRANEAITYLSGAPIEIFDSIKMLDQIVAKMRRWKQQNPAGALVVVDYLQLVKVPLERGRNREQEVSLVSKTIYDTGKELDVAVIELCQLNAFGNARESSAIEMDCTAFWQVVEDLDEHGAPVKGREQMRTVLVKFQRHGGMGHRIPFTFVGDWMRFTEGLDDDDNSQREFEHMPKKSHPPRRRSWADE